MRVHGLYRGDPVPPRSHDRASAISSDAAKLINKTAFPKFLTQRGLNSLRRASPGTGFGVKIYERLVAAPHRL